MNVKRLIKKIATLIYHPIVSSRLMIAGNRDFCIGPQLTINGVAGFKTLKLGKNVNIGRNGRLLFVTEYQGVRYEPGIVIGNNVSIENRFSCLSAAPIRIDDDCIIASDVLITSENHGTNPELSNSYADIPLTVGMVKIGKGCWIGEKVSIMPSVVLGDRCIVAANSVVTKSFPAGSMIAGIPARIIKKYDYSLHQWIKYNGEKNERKI